MRDGVDLLMKRYVNGDPEMERLLAEVSAESDRIQAEYDRTGIDPYDSIDFAEAALPLFNEAVQQSAPYDFAADGGEDTQE